MKKLFMTVAVILCLFIPVAAMASCSDTTPSSIADRYENVAADGEFVTDSGSKGGEAVFDMGGSRTFNTFVLKEKGSSITSFSLYADDDSEPFYSNDFIGGYRYCTFDAITAEKVRIRVNSCDEDWKLRTAEAYNISQSAEKARVMSYIYTDYAYSMDESHALNASYVTQFNVINCLYFDKDGILHFQDYLIDGKSVDGRTVLKGAVEKLHAFNPSAEIVVTVLGNKDLTGDNLDTEERHNSAMGDNRDVLIDQLLTLIGDYGLDGISFDYEYPYRLKSFSIYGKFIEKLDEALPEGKLLTAAVSEWTIGTGKTTLSHLSHLDSIEIMAYDMFDERGNHSTFYTSCYEILNNLSRKGVDMSKINLGIPFYSRPVTSDSFWGSYCDVADLLEPGQNTFNQPYTDLDGKEYPPADNYYNGRTLVNDKVCYALDYGVGGIMIWHFGCDSTDAELSLHGQINKAIESRLQQS